MSAPRFAVPEPGRKRGASTHLAPDTQTPNAIGGSMNSLPTSNPQHTRKNRAALKFGEKIPIFPCRADKTPYTKNGHLDATTDKSRITAWWNRWPNANPAAPTGERSGVFVLDVDKDKWGFGSLEALEEEHGELPTTYIVKTGGGGFHYYFRLPPDVVIRNSAGKLGRGLDVRGEGGYVLLPTSTSTGTAEDHEGRTSPAEHSQRGCGRPADTRG